MRSTVASIALALSALPVQAADLWSEIKSSAAGNTADLTTPQLKAGLIWPSEVKPGDEMLLVKTVYSRYSFTVFRQYIFVGVSGNSAKVEVVEQSKERTKKYIDLERGPDGSFRLAPEGLGNAAILRVSRIANPGTHYSVALERRE